MMVPPDDPPPRLEGLPSRYIVTRVLGHGAQKRVYLANDTILNRSVAIAALDTSILPNTLGAQLHEARTMAQVGDQPHVVAVYDIIESPPHVYVITRFLAGGDLEALLESCERRLPLRQAMRIATHVARALEFAHARGILHRDLKPANVFLDEQRTAHLGDFGLAVSNQTGPDPFADSRVGTPSYMAPEILQGMPSSAASDLYSFGCLLYELTTGRLPFTGRGGAVIQQHLHARPVDPRDLQPAIPNALSQLMLRLLAKRPADRPTTAADVRVALEGIARSGVAIVPSPSLAQLDGPPISARRGDPPLVQRGLELATLDHILASAALQQPALVLLSGEAGIGKSRLLREMRMRAEQQHIVTIFGQGYEDVTLPYRPFIEALRLLAGRLGELPAAEQGLLRKFLHLQEDSTSAERPESHQGDRHALFVAVYEALRHFAAAQPLMLIVDDLQWADAASVDLFEHIVFSLAQDAASGGAPLIVVAAIRAGEEPPRVLRALARFHREPLTHRMTLGGLDDAGVFELLQALGWLRPSSQLVRAIFEVTAGNPLFVQELVAELQRQGTAPEQSLPPHSIADLQLPTSVTGAVTARLTALPPQCERVLIHAAFLGGRFELSEIAMLIDLPENDVVELLDEAVAQRLIVDEGEVFAFTHALVRQVFYQRWSPTRRRQVHLRVARQLEAPAGARGRDEYRIAYHLIHAGSLAGAIEVAESTRRAADDAMARFAWFEAAQLLEAAITAHVQLSRAPLSELGDLHQTAGMAYYRCSDVGPCLQHLDAAVELYQTLSEPLALAGALTARARARFELGFVLPGSNQEIQLLRDTLARLPLTEPRLRANLLGILSTEESIGNDRAMGATLARAAIDLAESTGDSRLCALLHIDLGLAEFQGLQLAEAAVTYSAGVAHARRANDTLAETRCLTRLPVIHYLTGRLDDAQQLAVEARARNRRAGQPEGDLFTLAVFASVALARGDYRASVVSCQEALTLLRRGRYPWAAAAVTPVLAAACVAQNDVPGAHAATDLLLEPGLLFDDPSPLEVFVTAQHRFVDLYAGIDPGGAPPPPPPIFFGERGFDPTYLTELFKYVEIHAARGGGPFAPDVLQALVFADHSPVRFTVGWPLLVPRLLGVAAMVGGCWEEADAHFVRATEFAASVGATPELARTYVDHATMLDRRPGELDSPRIAHLLGAARPLLTIAGGTWFQQRATALGERISGAAGSARSV